MRAHKSNKRTLFDCDRCKFTYRRVDLRKQRGMLLCDPCFDSVLEIAPVNLKLYSPRANSTSTSAVTTPFVFTITTAGVTALSNSQVFKFDGPLNSYVMYVVGLPTTVTASAQIVAGRTSTLLTLVGTSDSNYVIINTGHGTDLTSQMVLKNNNVLSLVYNTTSSLWCETSRT